MRQLTNRTWLGVVAFVIGLGALTSILIQGKGESASDRVPITQSIKADEIPNRQEPVGWVFGRMIGFPGADRPLMPQSRSFSGSPAPIPSGRP